MTEEQVTTKKEVIKRMILMYLGVVILTSLVIFFYYEGPRWDVFVWIMVFFAFFVVLSGSLGYVFQSSIRRKIGFWDWSMLIVGSLLFIFFV